MITWILTKIPWLPIWWKPIAICILAVTLFGSGYWLKGRLDAALQKEAMEQALHDARVAWQAQHQADITKAQVDAEKATAAAQDRDQLQVDRDMLLAMVAELKARKALVIEKVIHDATGDHTCPDIGPQFSRLYNAAATSAPVSAPNPAR